jgi:hypothetical protein
MIIMARKKERVFDLSFFVKHGARGGKLGGKKAAEMMTPEERSERARKAVAGRKWHPVLSDAEKAARARAEAAKPKRRPGRPRKNPAA